MLAYNKNNKDHARSLRRNMTDAERLIWQHLRRKQILGIQFYRQKPIADFIVDFYAAKVKLVIEIDGAQHFEEANQQKDQLRDDTLQTLGLMVLRFDNHTVMTQTQQVMEEIYRVTEKRI